MDRCVEMDREASNRQRSFVYKPMIDSHFGFILSLSEPIILCIITKRRCQTHTQTHRCIRVKRPIGAWGVSVAIRHPLGTCPCGLAHAHAGSTIGLLPLRLLTWLHMCIVGRQSFPNRPCEQRKHYHTHGRFFRLCVFVRVFLLLHQNNQFLFPFLLFFHSYLSTRTCPSCSASWQTGRAAWGPGSSARRFRRAAVTEIKRNGDKLVWARREEIEPREECLQGYFHIQQSIYYRERRGLCKRRVL